MVLRLLIDAVHPDETRVVIADNSRIHDFDFVTAAKKQVKGNIYLAKITRVEPSLQAAFVEYGGGKQGFLPFAEIHPDYYQIPMADRKRLLEEVERDGEAEDAPQQSHHAEHAEHAPMGEEQHALQPTEGEAPQHALPQEPFPVQEGLITANADINETPAIFSEPLATLPQEQEAAPTAYESSENPVLSESSAQGDASEQGTREAHAEAGEEIETLASEEDAVRQSRPGSFYRRYKIQEVIKRNQIVLVQVIKEERGNKGVSLTTFISLAGRYCVLMPNSPKGGGISRKIMSGEDRKRLKEISAELKTARGMSAIIRTAGIDRTRAEIQRDYEYLVRLWENIREQTLSSTAPALIYEEGDLIKRTIRDLYTSDIEEIIVEGETGHVQAKEFMKTILASSAPKVKLYQDNVPLFYAYNIEDQLSSMYDPIVKLRSGGYIVLNPTEALISIDVNSGRMTGERNIEETATKTNLEAVHEIARQLRLRDLAGLIVIDLIDMMDSRNRRAVERALKDALKLDRAKIQLGRISPFGLLEMSRQRLRPSIAETSSMPCPHCQGKGLIRSDASVAIQVVRAMEKEAASGMLTEIRLTLPPSVALHLLNSRRDVLSALEQKYAIRVTVATDAALPQSQFRLEKIKNQSKRVSNNPPPVSGSDAAFTDIPVTEESSDSGNARLPEGEPVDNEILVPSSSEGGGARFEGAREERPRRRGRRGGRGRRDGNHTRDRSENGAAGASEPVPFEGGPAEGAAEGETGSNDNRPPRGDRGPRRRRGGNRWRERRDRQDNGSGERAAASGDNTAQPQPQSDRPREHVQAQPAAYTAPVMVSSHEPQRQSPPPVNPSSVLPLSEQASSDAKPKKGWWRKIIES